MQSVKHVMAMEGGTLVAHQGSYKLIGDYNCIISVEDEYHNKEK
jgi:hypothetical protein